MVATKINLTNMDTHYYVNIVWDHSYESFPTQIIIIQKFHNTKLF